ncbi:MAG TPA: hypothetical protein VHA73_12265 [Acidimicrobiales bacterium]|jgi:hypothetical protein|nr:hypothetical protein [Acidimicrobiales bacterium]
MRPLRTVLAVVLIAMLAFAGCGKSTKTAATDTGSDTATCPTSNTKSFAKTKFVFHVGLAAGTFHRYIYKPFKAGTFKKGAHGRIRALLKAGATALLDAHELKLAKEDVQANPTLCKILIGPLHALEGKFSSLKGKIAGGDTSSLDGINTDLTSLAATSKQNGAAINETTDENGG